MLLKTLASKIYINEVGAFLRNGRFFVLVSYLITLVGMVQFFAISKLLSRDQLGVYAMVVAISSLVSGISSWGFSQIGIKYGVQNNNGAEVGIFCGIYSLFLAIILSIIAIFFDYSLSLTGGKGILLFAGCISASFVTVRELFLIKYHCEGRFKYIGLSRLLAAITTTICVIFVTLRFPTANSIVACSLVVNFFIGALILAGIKIQWKEFFDNWLSLDKVNYFFKSGAPVASISITNGMFNRFDWIILGKYFQSSVLGGYSIVYRLYEFSYQSLGPVFTMIYPRLCKDKSDLCKKIHEGRHVIILSGFIVSFFLMMIVPFVLEMFFDSKFQDQYLTFRILAAGIPFIFMVGFYYHILMAQNKQNYLMRISMICLFLNAVLLLILVKEYGTEGAAIATLVPQVVQYVLMERLIKPKN